MASFWDFIGGGANYLLQQRQVADERKREDEKMKALEALRRETSDYEYNRNRRDAIRQVDPQQSYLDPASKQYVMVNSEGQEVGRRAATTSELQAAEAGTLKLEDMRTDIAYKKKQIDLMGRELSGSRRGLSGSIDSKPSAEEAKIGKLQALASTVINNLRKYNLPQEFIAEAEATLRSRINSGQISEKWIREFEARYLQQAGVRKTLRAASAAKAAEDILGPALKD